MAGSGAGGGVGTVGWAGTGGGGGGWGGGALGGGGLDGGIPGAAGSGCPGIPGADGTWAELSIDLVFHIKPEFVKIQSSHNQPYSLIIFLTFSIIHIICQKNLTKVTSLDILRIEPKNGAK